MITHAQPAVPFSVEELLTLLELLELPLPAILLPADDFLPGEGESRELIRTVALRGLFARGTITSDDRGGPVVDESLRGALAAFSAAHTLVHMAHEGVGGPLLSLLAVTRDLAAEMSLDAHGVVRVAAFDPTETWPRVRVLMDLSEGGNTEHRSFSVARGVLEAVGGLMDVGERPEAVTLLVGSGVPEGAAASFVDAMAVASGMRQVWVLVRGSGRVAEGVACAWVDGGERGLWRVPVSEPLGTEDAVMPGPADEIVEVTTVAAHDLGEEIRAALPRS